MAAALFQRPVIHRHWVALIRHLDARSATPLGVQSLILRSLPRRSVLTSLAAASTEGVSNASGGEGNGEQVAAVGVGYRTTDEIKAALYQALQGINRGIFGIQSAKKEEIESLVQQLESQNPITHPTDHLDKVDGCWKVVYSTVKILGVARTKLGLRDFITLGELFQTIDVAKGRAINVIEFSARGFKMLRGQLTIEASFQIASKTRVYIELENSTITPDQLMNLFQKNYELLLGIFNPAGWLEITYVDESLRTGRDDKGNLFILERAQQQGV